MNQRQLELLHRLRRDFQAVAQLRCLLPRSRSFDSLVGNCPSKLCSLIAGVFEASSEANGSAPLSSERRTGSAELGL